MSRIGKERLPGQYEKEILIINSFCIFQFQLRAIQMELYKLQIYYKSRKIQKRSLNYILYDYDKTYLILLESSKKSSKKIKRFQMLIIKKF